MNRFLIFSFCHPLCAHLPAGRQERWRQNRLALKRIVTCPLFFSRKEKWTEKKSASQWRRSDNLELAVAFGLNSSLRSSNSRPNLSDRSGSSLNYKPRAAKARRRT